MGKEKLSEDPVMASKKASKKAAIKRAQQEKQKQREHSLAHKSPSALIKEINRTKARHGEQHAVNRLSKLRDALRKAEQAPSQQQQQQQQQISNAPAVHGLENLRPDLKDTPSASTLPSHAQHKPQAPSMPPPSSTPPALQQKIAQQQQANFASAAPSTAQARAKGLTLPQQQQSACSANDESAAAGDPSTSGYALSTSAALTGASHTAHEETAAAVDESAAQRSEQAAQAGHANEDEGEEEAYVEHDNRFQNNAQAAPLPLPSEPPPPPEEEEVDEEPLPPPSTAGASKKSAPVIASEGTATRAEQNKKLTSMVPMNVARSRQQNQ